MKVYYMLNTELGWDSVVSIATSPQKCIEEYTDGEITPQTQEDVNEFLKNNPYHVIDYKTLAE